jgi:hypothetical protein
MRTINAYEMLLRIYERKTSWRISSRRRCEDIIKTDIKGVWYKIINWIRLAYVKIRWWVHANAVFNTRMT